MPEDYIHEKGCKGDVYRHVNAVSTSATLQALLAALEQNGGDYAS